MSIRYFCDRCGQAIKDYPKSLTFPSENTRRTNQGDFCNDCIDSFEKWLKNE